MEKVKTAFFGSSYYSIPYLESLFHNELIDLSLVVSQPDKPVGRGLELRASPTKEWAKQRQILTLTPMDLGNPLFLGTVSSLPLKLGVMAYYGLKIPKEVIEFFPLGILNIHHSLLPKHKGSNPIPWAIISGEPKTGTTVIKISEKFDEGRIAGASEEEITNTDTTQSLRQRLDARAVNLLEEVLSGFINGRTRLKKQGDGGSYDPKLTKETGFIDWSKTDEQIERTIRALTPWPEAWTTLQELRWWAKGALNKPTSLSTGKAKDVDSSKRVKILKAHLNENRKLNIDEIQIEGKNPIGWSEFKSGYLNS